MSSVNLHEFNNLSRRHNYFMTNNRKYGFPSLNENSILLKKILSHKVQNSTEKNVRHTDMRPRRVVRFNYPGHFTNIGNLRTAQNNSNKNKLINNQIINKIYDSDVKNYLSPYRVNKVTLDQNLVDSNCYKIPIKIYNRNSSYNDLYNMNSRLFSNSSNFNDSENEMRVLNFKGRKMFPSNSFYNLKNNDTINSPSKNESNINRESELFRNSEELKKKREEIYQRKMKRESSAIKREIMKREKDKDIKNQKLNIKFHRNTTSYKTDMGEDKDNSHIINKVKIIPLSKKGFNNDINTKNIGYNINEENRNKKIGINYTNIKNPKRRFFNYKNNSTNVPKNKKNNSHYNIFENESNLLFNNNNNYNNNNNNKSLYHKKNNVYSSNNIINSLPKNINNYIINNKIKQNLDYIRKTNKKEAKKDMKTNEQTLDISNNVSTDKHNNPYKFITSKKKFVEDYTKNNLVLFSKDKKVSIRVHTLRNLNELFLGKRNTKDKLKMQRIISIDFKDNNKGKNKNIIRYYKNNHTSKKSKELNPLTSIKEEEEKSKLETRSRRIKAPATETKLEGREKPFYQKNARMKYLKRSGNNK